MNVGIVIPALNEAECIGPVVSDCLRHTPNEDNVRVVVCDNGSTDDTATAARNAGAEVVGESRRGYGAACSAAISHLDQWPDALVFVDGDGSSDLRGLPALLEPIRVHDADVVIGWRSTAVPGAMTLPQRMGNTLTCGLLRVRFGVRHLDLGPFRAVTRVAFERMAMIDRTWGWNVEMHIKAVRLGLKIVQLPVHWRVRYAGASKISGRLSGVVRAGSRILYTFGRWSWGGRRHIPATLPEIVCFVRKPVEGMVKTRLSADIGAARATQYYRRMAMTTHRAVLGLQDAGLASATICGTGGTLRDFRDWLPEAARYRLQHGGSLGERLSAAFVDAFSRGAPRVAAIGTDCPTLDESTIARALGALSTHDVSVVPAEDGGYALIAMKRHIKELFTDMPWSTNRVLIETRERCAALGLKLAELEPLCDIDTAADLNHLPRVISIITPMLNERNYVDTMLTTLTEQAAACQERVEFIVADGGSTDGSMAAAERHGATVISAPRGRALQMNAAAGRANGQWLWFVHADCRPAPQGLRTLLACIDRHPRVVWGYFTPRIDARGIRYRLNEALIGLRSRILSLPFGDQGLFVRRDVFEQLGGYAELPIMEDVSLARALRLRARPTRIASPLLTSARRWQRNGYWRTTVLNWRIQFEYLVLGRDCRGLAQRYHSTSHAAGMPGNYE